MIHGTFQSTDSTGDIIPSVVFWYRVKITVSKFLWVLLWPFQSSRSAPWRYSIYPEVPPHACNARKVLPCHCTTVTYVCTVLYVYTVRLIIYSNTFSWGIWLMVKSTKIGTIHHCCLKLACSCTIQSFISQSTVRESYCGWQLHWYEKFFKSADIKTELMRIQI